MTKDEDEEPNDEATKENDYKTLFIANWFPTITYILMFSLVGMATSYIGPCLETMRCQLQVSEEFMTIIFGIHLFTVLLGTFISGFLNKLINANILLAFSGILLICSTALFGLFHSANTFIPILVINGLSTGFIENLCTIQMINLFGDKVGPFMQAMHFLFAFFAFIVLLISGPFIAEGFKSCKDMGYGNGSTSNVLTPLYSIISGLEVPAVICILVLVFLKHKSCIGFRHEEECTPVALAPNLRSSYTELDGDKDSREIKSSILLATGIAIVGTCMTFVAEGIQGEYNGFIFVYAIKVLNMEEHKEAAGYLTSTYWGFFATGRLITIFVATKVKTSSILIVDLVGLTLSTLPMIVKMDSIVAMYIQTCLLGLFLSNAVPGIITISEELLGLSRSKITALVMGASLGEACMPLLVGTLVNEVKPLAFPIFNFIIVIFLFLLFVLLAYLGSLTQKGLFSTKTFSPSSVKGKHY